MSDVMNGSIKPIIDKVVEKEERPTMTSKADLELLRRKIINSINRAFDEAIEEDSPGENVLTQDSVPININSSFEEKKPKKNQHGINSVRADAIYDWALELKNPVFTNKRAGKFLMWRYRSLLAKDSSSNNISTTIRNALVNDPRFVNLSKGKWTILESVSEVDIRKSQTPALGPKTSQAVTFAKSLDRPFKTSELVEFFMGQGHGEEHPDEDRIKLLTTRTQGLLHAHVNYLLE